MVRALDSCVNCLEERVIMARLLPNLKMVARRQVSSDPSLLPSTIRNESALSQSRSYPSSNRPCPAGLPSIEQTIISVSFSGILKERFSPPSALFTSSNVSPSILGFISSASSKYKTIHNAKASQRNTIPRRQKIPVVSQPPSITPNGKRVATATADR